jgi:CBS domain-containing membrane protein
MKNAKSDESSLSDDDLRAALLEMKNYVDVTEGDLRTIYEIAHRHAKQRIASRKTVQAVMTVKVITVSRNADLHEAARVLSENEISGMPVVDEANRVIGVISEADLLILAGMQKEHTFKDILRSMLGEPMPSKKRGSKVGDVMSFPPITSKAGDSLRDVALVLDERRIKRLPVVDDDGRLIGIISRADIVRAIGEQ